MDPININPDPTHRIDIPEEGDILPWKPYPMGNLNVTDKAKEFLESNPDKYQVDADKSQITIDEKDIPPDLLNEFKQAGNSFVITKHTQPESTQDKPFQMK